MNRLLEEFHRVKQSISPKADLQGKTSNWPLCPHSCHSLQNSHKLIPALKSCAYNACIFFEVLWIVDGQLRQWMNFWANAFSEAPKPIYQKKRLGYGLAAIHIAVIYRPV